MTFKVDEGLIKRLLESEARQTKKSLEKSFLNQTQAKVQPFDPDFLCDLCSNVVRHPSECDKCDKMACTACMNKWATQKDTCLSCKQHLVIRHANRKLLG